MFILYADKIKLTVRQRAPVTSGSVNACRARFQFSPDWEGLEKTAVFGAGGKKISVLLDEAGECTIPWEVLTTPLVPLRAGVRGTKSGDVVLPTAWAELGTIMAGVEPGDAARLPTPGLYDQLLEELGKRGSALGFTPEGELGLYAGERLLSAVSAGTGDHRLLSGRDAEGQHTIGAIEGLVEALERIPRPMTADELRKILKNGDAEYV